MCVNVLVFVENLFPRVPEKDHMQGTLEGEDQQNRLH